MTMDANDHHEECHMKHESHRGGGGSGGVYGLGMIGAWVYYFKGVTTFKEGAIAFGKGLVWPAFLVYDLLVFLKKE
jgi:hypothetical protein